MVSSRKKEEWVGFRLSPRKIMGKYESMTFPFWRAKKWPGKIKKSWESTAIEGLFDPVPSEN